MNSDGTRQTSPTKNAFFRGIGLVFSLNGTRISFERTNPSNGSRDIFTMRADGNRRINLTESCSVEANPSWQPMP